MSKRPTLPEKIQKLKHERTSYQKLIDEYCKRRVDLKREMLELFHDDDAMQTECYNCDVIHCPLRQHYGRAPIKCRYYKSKSM